MGTYSDSTHMNDVVDLGIRSEKTHIHERNTPTKLKPLASRNESLRSSIDGPGLSLPELTKGACEKQCYCVQCYSILTTIA